MSKRNRKDTQGADIQDYLECLPGTHCPKPGYWFVQGTTLGACFALKEILPAHFKKKEVKMWCWHNGYQR